MFTHIVIGSNDLDRSQRFYDAAFSAAGYPAGQIDPKGRIVYAKEGLRLLVTKPINGEPASFANGGTIGMLMASPEAVQGWHDAGVANGGTSIEDAPGVRETATSKSYLAYLRDPDGNKLCAVYRYPREG